MNVLFDRFDVFASGFWLTVQLCLLSAIGALLLGTVVGILRISPLPPLRAVGTAYVTIFRNVPLAVVMFFMAFGLPALGSDASFLKVPLLDSVFSRLTTDLPYFRFAVIALALYTAAFVCEAIRSGFNAVSVGQAEAARSLGLTFTQSVRSVILPQALRASVVPLGSVIIAMIKNSALAGFFGVVGDLAQTADQLTSAEGYAFVPVAVGISAGYLVLTVPLGLLIDRLDRRPAVGGLSTGGAANVLYDAPGPRTAAATRAGSVAMGVAIVIGAYLLLYRPLADGGQFDEALWGPLVDPSNEYFSQVWQRIGSGMGATLTAAAIAIVTSLGLGTLLALLRVRLRSSLGLRFIGLPAPVALAGRGLNRLLAALTRTWVEVFRGLPVVLTIFFVSATLPALGVKDPIWYVVGGLTLYNMVVIGEILRSGMYGLPAGQREAAAALGLTSAQTTRMILLPQALRTMLPALISQVVVIVKDTSLGFITSYEEVMNTAKQVIGVLGNPIQMYFVIGAMFIAVNYLLSKLAQYTQRRLSRAGRSTQGADSERSPVLDRSEPVTATQA